LENFAASSLLHKQLDRFTGIPVTSLKIERRDFWLHMQHIDQNSNKSVVVVVRCCAQPDDEAI